MTTYSVREEIIELVNKLFIFTDTQDWAKLQADVFTGTVDFDMLSVGGEKKTMTAAAICETWSNGFKGIDAINHLAGNYLVSIADTKATVFAYATATHYKKSASKGTTREFVGTYDIGLHKQDNGWRINAFRYTLKYASGNLDLS